jgi:hypothetical protein
LVARFIGLSPVIARLDLIGLKQSQEWYEIATPRLTGAHNDKIRKGVPAAKKREWRDS